MADCSALLDEELSSFVFNYLTDSQVSGEEALCLDFPEIDLSQLDAGDFDSTSCFNELQWCSDHSENESGHYSTDDPELFQITDSENEALLAALTQTLDDIEEDDVGFSAFQITGDRDLSVPPSPKPSVPALPPPAPEADDELSLLKKLLLSPAHVAQSFEVHKDVSAWRHGGPKSRSQHACIKVENHRERKSGFFHGQTRICSELHKHLISAKHSPQTKAGAPAGDGPDNVPQYKSPKGEDSGSEEEVQSPVETVSGDSLSQDSLPTSPQFTCDKEMEAMVALIQYMHTYCLPQRKLLLQESDVKHQHCTNFQKRAKLDGKPTAPTATSASCMKQSTSLELSILKELLVKDVPCDVSKPYRLVQPTYSSLPCAQNSKTPRVLTQEADAPGLSKIRGKTQLEVITPKQCLRPSPGVQVQSHNVKQHTATAASESKSLRVPQKLERGLYAVRRSKRLNPELSKWFFFRDEKPTEDFESEDEGEVTIAKPMLSLEAAVVFDKEEQVTRVEVGGTSTESQHPLMGSGAENGEDRLCSQLRHPDKPRCLSLALSQSDPSFGKKSFEQTLTVELSGTAGLTPPTTPPYKPADEELYKPDMNHKQEKNKAVISPSVKEDEVLGASREQPKKHPERTELLAHLSQGVTQVASLEQQTLKRPFSRSFGDHDYCLARKPEASLQRKVLKSWEPPKQVGSREQQGMGRCKDKDSEASLTEGGKQLKDHEIRASLTKHFGSLEDEITSVCKSPDYATNFEDSVSDSGSPVEDECCVLPCKPKLYPHRSPSARASGHHCPQNRSTSETSCCRSRSPANRRAFRCENRETCQERYRGGESQSHTQKRREKAIDEGRMVCIRNLSRNISPSELKKRFEVFGEIVECRVLSRSNREDKYGFITYRCSEDAALSLRKGTSLRKRNEPSFQLSYGGHRHFFWTRYADLDSSAEEPSTPSLKSKYECMDFDSLLREAQMSLHR
ncbi:peroxisome proliferator-activated receptor gamma coactivator 1-beta [Microcaecilia unicolor]|uniref:Peroxisome proliferator-activated receptor gamma coactivator 1-beta n=1 Tax=Microcaecilia unicolor TaxID=1415580 RepID=A0A6P7YWY9_9AMPH|nr:peroxisome proliferator-activated receptor gamma coactivator 1-beta [Microcaecilia unicolor]